jgi:hypothetical protein
LEKGIHPTFIFFAGRLQLGDPPVLGLALLLQVAVAPVYLDSGGDELDVGGHKALQEKTKAYNILSNNH